MMNTMFDIVYFGKIPNEFHSNDKRICPCPVPTCIQFQLSSNECLPSKTLIAKYQTDNTAPVWPNSLKPQFYRVPERIFYYVGFFQFVHNKTSQNGGILSHSFLSLFTGLSIVCTCARLFFKKIFLLLSFVHSLSLFQFTQWK